jgi:hypothetical protein
MAHSDRPLDDEVSPEGAADGFECDACGKRFPGKPAASGYLLSTRGDEVRFEEPPLCEQCAQAL